MELEPTSPGFTDVTTALAKGLISGVPLVGGTVVELGNLLDKRERQWKNKVIVAINEIRDRFQILPEQLQNDEKFCSFFVSATFIAIKNHQQEKLTALGNALVSVMDPNGVAEDLAFTFLRYVDELTPNHVRILQCLNDRSAEFASAKNVQVVYDIYTSLTAYSIEKFAFRSFLEDLRTRLLIVSGHSKSPS